MPNARQAKSAREKAAELRAEAERKAARNRVMLVGSIVIVAVLVIVGVTVLVRTLQNQQDEKVAAQSAPPANLYTPTDQKKNVPGILIGQPTAKVTVDMYEDFQCPVCKQFESTDGALLKQYADAGKVKLIYHPVAILDRASSTEYSSRSGSAAAAVLAIAPKSFPAYHTALFDNQPPENGDGLPDSTLIQLATSAGVPEAQISSAITGQKYRGWITKVTDQFTKDFAPGATPTVVINGTQLKDIGPDKLKAALDQAVTAAK